MKAREKRRKRAARKANMPARLARAADALRRVYGFDGVAWAAAEQRCEDAANAAYDEAREAP